MNTPLQKTLRRSLGALFLGLMLTAPLAAQENNRAPTLQQKEQTGKGGYPAKELVVIGHNFFGGVSGGLASIIETAVQRYGQPNAYILGQEASGSYIAGLQYGEGVLYTDKDYGLKVFWQGPSIGFDAGANGTRVMMLVYDLASEDAIFKRYPGVNGSAYFVGGVGMTVLKSGGTVIVPIRSGIGARLGVNVGYLKFTPKSTWNPF